MEGQESSNPTQPSGLSPRLSQPTLSTEISVPGTSQSRQIPSKPGESICTYPIPIPPSKYSRALQLYTRYIYEDGLAQHHTFGPGPPPTTFGPFSNSVPVYPGSSRSSRSSQQHSPISTATYDSLTDISSVVSLTKDEPKPSGQDNDSSNLVYRPTRMRIRERLAPVATAKVALLRCLGSCSSCRSRRTL